MTTVTHKQPMAERGRPFNTEATAHLIGVAPGTLRNWRCAGMGPRSHRIGGKVVFFERDIDIYLNGCASDAEQD